MLLSVSGRPWVPLDLAHSMKKERNVRKMSECTFPNAKHNYNASCSCQVIQKRDQAFHSHHPKRFKTSSQKSGGTSLLINGSPNSDPSCVLPLWADHFSNLSTSRLSNNPSLQKIWNTIPEAEIATLVDEESILDVSFVPEEVDAAINCLKRSSSAGPDSLSPQHLIYADPLLKSWLCKVVNTIVNFEAIPSQFKVGIIVPIYKGKGKDPLLYTRKLQRHNKSSFVMGTPLIHVFMTLLLPLIPSSTLFSSVIRRKQESLGKPGA